jgi:hypothetical protein
MRSEGAALAGLALTLLVALALPAVLARHAPPSGVPQSSPPSAAAAPVDPPPRARGARVGARVGSGMRRAADAVDSAARTSVEAVDGALHKVGEKLEPPP